MSNKANWFAAALLVFLFFWGMAGALLIVDVLALENPSEMTDAQNIRALLILLFYVVLITIGSIYLTANYVKSADVVLVSAFYIGLVTVFVGVFAAFFLTGSAAQPAFSLMTASGAQSAPIEPKSWLITSLVLAQPLGIVIGGLTAIRFLVKNHATRLEGRRLQNFIMIWAVIFLVTAGVAYDYQNTKLENFFVNVGEIKIRAEAGDLEAQMRMGHLRLKSTPFDGIRRDPEEAINWFRMAADAGSYQAMGLVGTTLDVELNDPSAAAEWYLRAGENGDHSSLFALAEMYYLGRGVEANAVEAVKWWTLSAEKGGNDAKKRLGEMYVKGDGVPKDLIRAYMWQHLATCDQKLGDSDDPNRVRLEQLAAILTPDQLSEAEEVAADWLSAHGKNDSRLCGLQKEG